jgi:hypothetical protein
MSLSTGSRRLGLAAFAVGLSLAAPQAAGVAAADSSGADSASAVQADSTAGLDRVGPARRSAVVRSGVKADASPGGPAITETRGRTATGGARTAGGPASTVRTGRNKVADAAAAVKALSATASRSPVSRTVAVNASPPPLSASADSTVAVNTSPAPLPASADSTTGAPVAASASVSADYRPERLTWRSIIVDVFSWSGLGSSVPSLPIPEAPVPDLIAGLWTAVRRLHYTFFNSVPTLNPTAYSEDPTTGVITGDLGGADADGDVLTYIITSVPTHGTLAVADNGTYTYTPDLATSHSGGTDSFAVRVSDTSTANPWHIRPVSDLIAGLIQVLSGFGLAAPGDPATATVVVTPTPITSSRKPGLIQSSELTVNVETGEANGDEPVMVTVVMEVTLGVSGSTRVKVVNASPGQLGSGVKAGQTINIPGSDGNVWLDNVKPLSVDDFAAAAASESAIPIPVVVTATLMLEGDLTAGYLIGNIGRDEMASKLRGIGKVLESISATSVTDAPKAFADALPQIKNAVAINATAIGGAIALRIGHWVASAFDPDDPIGLSLTVLVPCDSSMKDVLDAISQLSPEVVAELGLDAQWLRNDVLEIRTGLWNTDVNIRSGLLLPPESLPNGPATWTTEYKGRYAEDYARYTVKTTAYPY